MDDRWQIFFEKFRETVTVEQLPVNIPRFDLELSELAGAAADWCNQYLKDRYNNNCSFSCLYCNICLIMISFSPNRKLIFLNT